MRPSKLFSKNYCIYFFILFGIATNIYLIRQNAANGREAARNERISCEIDVENLLNLIESRQVQQHEGFSGNQNISPPLPEKTVQTSLFAFPGGSGLGNKLFELISLRGIADTLQRTPIINVVRGDYVEALLKKIQPIYPNLLDQFQLRIVPTEQITRQQANFGACCKFDDPFKWVNSSAKHLLLDGHYFQSFKYFSHLRSNIRNWMAPRKLDALRAETLLPASHRDDFIICTHVRRGDFQFDGVHQPSDPVFSRAATDYLVRQYQKTHNKVSVVVLGNDIFFAHTVFEDKVASFDSLKSANYTPNYSFVLPTDSPQYTVILTPTLNPEIDLAFSHSFCDVTLITAPSSTFGWWLSYLAKPAAINYYRDIIESKDGVAREMKEADFYPSNWIKLVTDSTGTIRKAIVH